MADLGISPLTARAMTPSRLTGRVATEETSIRRYEQKPRAMTDKNDVGAKIASLKEYFHIEEALKTHRPKSVVDKNKSRPSTSMSGALTPRPPTAPPGQMNKGPSSGSVTPRAKSRDGARSRASSKGSRPFTPSVNRSMALFKVDNGAVTRRNEEKQTVVQTKDENDENAQMIPTKTKKTDDKGEKKKRLIFQEPGKKEGAIDVFEEEEKDKDGVEDEDEESDPEMEDPNRIPKDSGELTLWMKEKLYGFRMDKNRKKREDGQGDKKELDWRNEIKWIIRHQDAVLKECQTMRKDYLETIEDEKGKFGSKKSKDEIEFNLLREDSRALLLLAIELVPSALEELGIPMKYDGIGIDVTQGKAAKGKTLAFLRNQVDTLMTPFKWDTFDLDKSTKKFLHLFRLRDNLLTRMNSYITGQFLPLGFQGNNRHSKLPFALVNDDRDRLSPHGHTFFNLAEGCLRAVQVMTAIPLPADFSSCGEQLAKVMHEKSYVIDRLGELERRQMQEIYHKDDRIKELEFKLKYYSNPEVYEHLMPRQQMVVELDKWKTQYEKARSKIVELQGSRWRLETKSRGLQQKVHFFEKEQNNAELRLGDIEKKVEDDIGKAMWDIDHLRQTVEVTQTFNREVTKENNTLQGIITQLKQDHEDLYRTHTQTLDFFEQQKKDDDSTIYELKEDLTAVTDNRNELASELSEAKREIVELKAKIEDFEKMEGKEENELIHDNNMLANRIRVLEQDMHEKSEEVDRIIKGKEETEKQIGHYQRALKSEKERSQKNLEEMAAKYEEEKKVIQKEAHKTIQMIQASMNAGSRGKASGMEFLEENRVLKDQMASMQKEMESLKAQLQESGSVGEPPEEADPASTEPADPDPNPN